MCTKEMAEAANGVFEKNIHRFLSRWVQEHEDKTLLRFGRPLEEYLATDALHDLFMSTPNALQKLLTNIFIACHLGRRAYQVYFDPQTGDPLLAPSEQRIYNLARRMDSERVHVPFRSVHPVKQTAAGDTADISTYPGGSAEIRYNSGNHFSSRPANGNVFNENSKRCTALSGGHLHVFYKRGFMEERLQEAKALTIALRDSGETMPQFFMICSRHSLKEGHYGVSLVVMDPINPDFPKRVMICDTLLKELPHHPRWWPYFVTAYTNVFGDAVTEIMEDISHPLQKVNITGDEPYRHDWDCPYYAASMADALAEIVVNDCALVLNGKTGDIHHAMKAHMTEYYQPCGSIKDRLEIKQANRLKRWKSGRELIKNMVADTGRRLPYEL